MHPRTSRNCHQTSCFCQPSELSGGIVGWRANHPSSPCRNNHTDCAERIREKFRKTNAEGRKRPENQKKIIGWEFLVERDKNGSVENYDRIPRSELEDLTGCRFTGMTCCAGTSVVKIGVDGRAKGMVCDLDGPICNIFEENPFMCEDWIHSVLCTKNMCGCEVNYRIPKFRSSDEAQKFIAEKKLEQKILMSEYLDNKKNR